MLHTPSIIPQIDGSFTFEMTPAWDLVQELRQEAEIESLYRQAVDNRAAYVQTNDPKYLHQAEELEVRASALMIGTLEPIDMANEPPFEAEREGAA